jgi:hypothetical protein
MLYATGLNAWNQLQFEPSRVDDEEPHDLSSFTRVLQDDDDDEDEHDDPVDRIRALYSYTLGQ